MVGVSQKGHFFGGAMIFSLPVRSGHHRPADVGNDVARSFDDDAIADADVLARDVVVVVQRGALDGDAAHVDRFEDGIGRHDARAPDVHAHVEQQRRRFARREFQRNRAARVFAHDAQFLLQVQIVDLDHHAVGFKGQRVALVDPRFGVRDGLVERVEAFGDVGGGKPDRVEVVQQFESANAACRHQPPRSDSTAN